MNWKLALAAAAMTIITSAAYAQNVDPAPSGNEQAVAHPGDGYVVLTPGRDAPVIETPTENGVSIEFTMPDDPHPDDTTIEYPDPPDDAGGDDGGGDDGGDDYSGGDE